MTITKSGELASFYTVNKAPIKHLKVYFGPKQAGEGTPSPENVREISGWTANEVHITGKNLFPDSLNDYRSFSSSLPDDISFSHGTYSGTVVQGARDAGVLLCDYCYKPGTYTLSFDFQGTTFEANQNMWRPINIVPYTHADRAWYEDKVNIPYVITKNQKEGHCTKTFTIGYDFKLSVNLHSFGNNSVEGVYTISNIQLELGSTATEFEPYRGQTHTLDWTNNIGTVYGGYVDLVTGELVEETQLYTFTGQEGWNYYSSQKGSYLFISDWQPLLADTTVLGCNMYKCNSYNNARAEGWPDLSCEYTWDTSTFTKGGVLIQDYRFYSTGSWKSYLAELYSNGTPLQVVGLLKTPIVYQLTPTQLSTLIGRNNIWSNADRVEVEYDLAESNDELYRRRNILLRSAPHIETASGNIAHFETDIAAPIKSAKISFSPVQEGSGDPSPSNVRAISGFTNLSLYHSGENLYVPNSNNKGYISKSGVITVDETSTYTDLIPVNLGDVYSFECTTVSVNGDTNRRIHGYNSSGTWVKQLASGTTAANTVEDRKISATIPAGISYIRVSFRNQDTDVRIVKENIIEANWSTAAGTIYGGYVDLATGELVRTYDEFVIGGGNNLTIAGDNYCGEQGTNVFAYISSNCDIANYTEITSSNLLCNRFEIAKYGIWTTPDSNIGKATLNARTQFHMVFDNSLVGINSTDTKADRISKISAYLADNKVQVCFTMQTPARYTLSPITLRSLRGINNIWSNTNGPVEIKYWTH